MTPETPRPKWPWITLIVLQTLQLLSLLPWMMMAGLAVMAFDAPGSDKMWQPWTFVIAIWSYPFWILLGTAGSWILFAVRCYKSAVAACVLFALVVPAFLFAFFLLAEKLGW